MPAMEIFSPAKINLFLSVKGKRRDGYHELVTLLCRIDLCDTITLEFKQNGITCYCAHPDVPNDDTNLAHQAAALFFSRLNGQHPDGLNGVSISIKKNIPVGAGLGGGSSNAASVLMALNAYYDHFFSQEHLMKMGVSLGADVPFFIFKKPAIASGIGEKLKFFKGLEQYKILLVYPGEKVSTRMVYKNLNLGLTKCKQKLNCLLFEKASFKVPDHLCNDLETIACNICPDIILIKEYLKNEGACGSLMSGSGSSVFGLFSEEETAYRAYGRLSENKNWEVHLANMMV